MTDLVGLLEEFHREKLGQLLRHQAGARLVQQYDANNTYQYIINREAVQLSWIATGRAREVHALIYVFAILFLARYALLL